MEHDDLRLRNQLCFRLYTASRLIIKSYTPLLSKLGLTYPQYVVMMALWERDRRPVNDIAKQLMLQTNTVTPLLKRMEAMGLVARKKCAGDHRQTIVELTAKGSDMENEAGGIPATQVQRFICNGATDETIPGLTMRLDALIEILTAMTAGEGGTAEEKGADGE